MIRPACIVVSLSLALGGCAGTEGYPSLQRRPAETADTIPPLPVATAPAPVASPGMADRLAGLVASARAAHGQFGQLRGRTESLIAAAAGAPVASESWSVASIALAELTAARGATMTPVAELDRLYADDRLAHVDTPGGDSAAITAARDTVMPLIAEEDAQLARLGSRLAQ